MSTTPDLSRSHAEDWPELPYPAWKTTLQTLHMWAQIVGKVRLTLSPHINHWWQVPFYLTARGLTTSLIPYAKGAFEVQFDFIDHQLLIQSSNGASKTLTLQPRSVADFYQEFMAALNTLDIQVAIHTLPNEVPNPIPFEQDHQHAAYDPLYVNHFWHILLQTDAVLREYRAPFIGKSSPIHFFWGSFDLAVTFFSGRRAPERPEVDPITREAYSHEVISCGFWPGNDSFPEPAFYSYTAPAPDGLEQAAVQPASAFYNTELKEFFLRYSDVRSSTQPAQSLLAFFNSTYEAGASHANWDRSALESR